jgi:hypothetical protein
MLEKKEFQIQERKLLKVNDRILFQNKSDYLKILPDNLPGVFTNRELAKISNFSVRAARQITYCLRKSGVIRLAEKKRKELKFQKV